ncbi:hypothetical protein CRG98_047068 [Punica granatum]|uniref:Uncharacterized protein n=1 Tax=Punica granatum TaxID=22663 RepID=A0A2I0HLE5_PUNGR|nr:hypothetical protein CRG98_047068 [Punica granatum]
MAEHLKLYGAPFLGVVWPHRKPLPLRSSHCRQQVKLLASAVLALPSRDACLLSRTSRASLCLLAKLVQA